MIHHLSFDRLRHLVAGAAGTVAIGVIAACGGHAGGAAQPSGTAPSDAAAGGTARATVESFMRAVADSDLTKMAKLWGSSKGPAASTGQPADYQRRIVLIQSYLRSDDYRIAADMAEGNDRRSMQVELRRQACTWSVPFAVAKVNQGTWVITGIDLTHAGNPARPCDPDAKKDSTGH